MEALKKSINDARTIKESTLNSYLTSIRKLHNAIFDTEIFKNIDFLMDFDEIVGAISALSFNSQRSYTNAVIVALTSVSDKKHENALQKYRDFYEKLNTEYRDIIEKNEKSETEKENWVELKELKKVMNGYKRELNERDIFKKDKDTITKKSFDLLQRWVVANLYLHDSNPPVRLNYGDLGIVSEKFYNNLDDGYKETNNFLVIKSRNIKYFSFGDFKTKSSMGLSIIPVGKILNSVLNIWLKFNVNDYLLVDSRGGVMNSNQLSKYIARVFEPTGKKITINILRHIYISTKFPVADTKFKKEIAKKMLHSGATQDEYAKV